MTIRPSGFLSIRPSSQFFGIPVFYFSDLPESAFRTTPLLHYGVYLLNYYIKVWSNLSIHLADFFKKQIVSQGKLSTVLWTVISFSFNLEFFRVKFFQNRNLVRKWPLGLQRPLWFRSSVSLLPKHLRPSRNPPHPPMLLR